MMVQEWQEVIMAGEYGSQDPMDPAALEFLVFGADAAPDMAAVESEEAALQAAGASAPTPVEHIPPERHYLRICGLGGEVRVVWGNPPASDKRRFPYFGSVIGPEQPEDL
jgi:hypothetical protein